MFDLTGKVALVTGATGGIGGSIARALHNAGATVVLTGRRQEVLDKMSSEIEGSIAVAADFNQDGAAQDLIKQVEEKAGKMMDSCKGKPEFMTLLNNSYDISTRLDYEMDIFQNRSESDIGGIRGDALK